MKNKFKLTGLFLLVTFSSIAQIAFELSMEFDKNSNSYKVIAIPNFSMKEFLWGPSQISIVFPEKMEDNKLVLVSHNGGNWADNSTVFAPKAQADCDFHGFGSNGAKLLNVIKDEPILLFEIKEFNTEVGSPRLFDNKKDPMSYNEGMKGSDFSHSIIGHSGEELYAGNLEKIEELNLVQELNSSIVSFPNPSQGKFTLKTAGIDLKETETISFYSASGSKLFEADFIIKDNKVNIELPETVGDQKIFLRLIDKNSTPHTSKIVIQK